MTELKPCPFCGGEASASCERKANYLYMVVCLFSPSNVVSVVKNAEFIFGRTV